MSGFRLEDWQDAKDFGAHLAAAFERAVIGSKAVRDAVAAILLDMKQRGQLGQQGEAGA